MKSHRSGFVIVVLFAAVERVDRTRAGDMLVLRLKLALMRPYAALVAFDVADSSA